MKELTIELNQKEFETIQYITNSKDTNQIGMLSKDLINAYSNFLDYSTYKMILDNKVDYVIFVHNFA